ncbi:hypothetical protein Hanom_Chr01g00084731 [Helianthus anomalus]
MEPLVEVEMKSNHKLENREHSEMHPMVSARYVFIMTKLYSNVIDVVTDFTTFTEYLATIV